MMLRKLFGTANERILRGMQPLVQRINALEPELANLSDSGIKEQTEKLRARLNGGEKPDAILPEAFATVREAAKRALGQRHFDVQLLGGITLHRGIIAEMKTGEGKTLVATLPAYLNALSGKGVHIVTVNDYLAKRDAEWMGRIYRFLGLSVGCIVHDLRDPERREAYAANITYGTNNEFGFDYLRDNMKFTREEMVQRPFHYAIVDEVDSILIDEARTPLIISGPVDDRSDLYITVDKIIPKLKKTDYEIDEKTRSVTLTEEGTQHVEDILKNQGLVAKESSLYDLGNITLVHHVDQALKAHTLFKRDTDYIVKDNRVIIIDEFTGRMMEGRRYSEGLHQALEAKESTPVQQENQTLASITFQNYFRLYPKLAGMTGTAMTEAAEFNQIYKLEALEIPTNVPVTRIDEDDEIYRTAEEKFDAIIRLIRACHIKKQPVLVGTVSIEKSETLAKRLKKEKIPHHVLNARHHEKEASIIAQAGQPGAVTIATNMAGRGTDIQLGGNPDMLLAEKIKGEEKPEKIAKLREQIKTQVAKDKEIVLQAGGLCVIGTERHESRRIDNQLRGRSGRQGDPGYTKFYLSLEDDLMRIFGADKKMDFVMRKMGMPGEPIAAPILSRVLEKAQARVEARNFEIRKNLLRFDDVMNDQRKVIFEQRIELMEATDVSDTITDMRVATVEDLIALHVPEKAYHEQWDLEGLEKEAFRIFGLHIAALEWAKEEGVADAEIRERLAKSTANLLAEKEKQCGADTMRTVEKRLLLFTLDELWKDHLLSLDHLRQGINLRAYSQKDPLNEYKREAFMMFDAMLGHLREVVVTRLAHLELRQEPPAEALLRQRAQRMMETRHDPSQGGELPPQAITVITNKPQGPRDPADPATWGKVGRNDPCPCGSGKKYKQCHGKL